MRNLAEMNFSCLFLNQGECYFVALLLQKFEEERSIVVMFANPGAPNTNKYRAVMFALDQI